MSGHYKIIHFLPDHFSGERIPVGAVVAENGSVNVVLADRTPGPECLGSDATYMLLRDTLDELRQLTSLERLPMSIGPHFEMSEASDLPALDGDAVSWLRQRILPRAMEKPSSSRKRGPSRSSVGLDYLRQFNVARYVKQFRPKKDLHELNGASESLPAISQGVRGANQLLLMEPVIPTRRQLDKDLKTIGTNFFAYRGAFQTHPIDTDVDLIAYVTPGGNASIRSEIVARLGESADRVYDVTAMSARKDLVNLVATIGKSGDDLLT